MNDGIKNKMVKTFVIVDMTAGLIIILAISLAVGMWLLPAIGIENTGIQIAAGIVTGSILLVKGYDHIVYIWHHTLGTVLVFTLSIGIMIIVYAFSNKDK